MAHYIENILHGGISPEMQAKSMRELNSILHAPFMVSDDALNFSAYDYYTKDEKE